jgi:hypothetical protein
MTQHTRGHKGLSAGRTSAVAAFTSHAAMSSSAAVRNTSQAMTAAWPTSAARAVTAMRTRTLSGPRRVSDSTRASLTTGLTCLARDRSKSAATAPHARRLSARGTSSRTVKRGRARLAIMLASIPGSTRATLPGAFPRARRQTGSCQGKPLAGGIFTRSAHRAHAPSAGAGQPAVDGGHGAAH